MGPRRGVDRAALVGLCAAAFLLGCGGNAQVGFVNQERPSNTGGSQLVHHAHNQTGSKELDNDDEIVEPDRPMVGTAEERALVHVHAGKEVCSGAMVSQRVVLTSHQCFRSQRGVGVVGKDLDSVKVEIASSALTWTERQGKYVFAPSCDWKELDLVAIVLTQPAEWVKPLRVSQSPGAGAKVDALGFGRCAGEGARLKPKPAQVLSVEGDAIILGVALCRGDVGGPIIDGAGSHVVGLVSRRDDPEGSPRKTTTAVRLDTAWARNLVARAEAVANGGEVPTGPFGCER